MKSYSADGQDLFVQKVTKGKRDGVFLEIGSAMPIANNNTYVLESEYGWTGLLIENNPQYLGQLRHVRTSTVVGEDATTIDYKVLFEKHDMPKVIDYLSLDIDPPDATLEVLKRLPLDDYCFKCVTFEHDRYWFGDSVAEESRKIFREKGYMLYEKDVMCSLGPFEDWYVRHIDTGEKC
jgi:hypothetical protein